MEQERCTHMTESWKVGTAPYSFRWRVLPAMARLEFPVAWCTRADTETAAGMVASVTRTKATLTAAGTTTLAWILRRNPTRTTATVAAGCY